jgi:uncharacterized protein (TIGR02757 family)
MDRRLTRVRDALDAVRAGCDTAARREADPVGIVHRYEDAADRELVALVAACIAFGNAKVIRAKLEDLLARVGPHPARAADDARAVTARLRTWRARVFRGEDVARLLVGARRVQRKHGSLGAFFEKELERLDAAGAEDGDADRSAAVREALARLCDSIRAAGGLARRSAADRRGPSHLLPDPRGPSGCKRLLLFLRWMARPADGVDLGMWSVPADRLLVPVDVHIHRLARNLGLTKRRGTSWKTTAEITQALARFDSADPVSYDFALCHLGIRCRTTSRSATWAWSRAALLAATRKSARAAACAPFACIGTSRSSRN